MSKGVFYQTRKCSGGNEMKLNYYKRDGYYFRCGSTSCTCGRSTISASQGSFFAQYRNSVHKVLYVVYLFLNRTTLASTVAQSGLSRPTVRSIISKIYLAMEADLNTEDVQIGRLSENVKVFSNGIVHLGGVDSNGNPIVVEIDESKFGKRHGNKGHRVEGVWVVGGVERTPDRKVFLVTVPNRTADTLKKIIDHFVLPGKLVLFEYSIKIQY